MSEEMDNLAEPFNEEPKDEKKLVRRRRTKPEESENGASWTEDQWAEITSLAVPVYHDLLGGTYRGYDPKVAAEQAFAHAAVLYEVRSQIIENGVIPKIADRTKSTVTAPNLREDHPVRRYIEAGEPGPEWWKTNDSVDRSMSVN